jgi:hypothetical protein
MMDAGNGAEATANRPLLFCGSVLVARRGTSTECGTHAWETEASTLRDKGWK